MFDSIACPQTEFDVSVTTTTYDAVASSGAASGVNSGRVRTRIDPVCIGPSGQSDYVTFTAWILVFVLYTAIALVFSILIFKFLPRPKKRRLR